jgi:lipopolysaccharide biosynthesis glycosyltransferase
MFWNTDKRPQWRNIAENLPRQRASSDQVIFNTIYGSFFLDLPGEFNWLAYQANDSEKKNQPYLVHYAGPYKPWHLHPSLYKYCAMDKCTWYPYHETIREILEKDELKIQIAKWHKKSMLEGQANFGGAATFKSLLSPLYRVPVLAKLLVSALRLARGLFPPQDFHPIHAHKYLWNY